MANTGCASYVPYIVHVRVAFKLTMITSIKYKANEGSGNGRERTKSKLVGVALIRPCNE